MTNFLNRIYQEHSEGRVTFRKEIVLEQIRKCEIWVRYGLLKKSKIKGRVAFIPKFSIQKFRKMELVEIDKLRTLKMVAGNEKRYSKVVHRGIIKEWVGFGWIDLDSATLADYSKYPVVV